jgi:hypothetical protein
MGGTYTSVLAQLQFKAAEAVARLVLATAARNPGKRHRTRPRPSPETSAAARPSVGPEPVRPKQSRHKRRRRKGRTHMTPTRHPKIKAA